MESVRKCLLSLSGVIGLLIILSPTLHAQSLSSTPLGPTATSALIVGNALDLTSTLMAVHSLGLEEKNPLLGKTALTIVPLKVALTAVQVYGVKRMAAEGHPRWARTLAWGLGVGFSALAVRNTRVRR